MAQHHRGLLPSRQRLKAKSVFGRKKNAVSAAGMTA
jgi:hypothetical protein